MREASLYGNISAAWMDSKFGPLIFQDTGLSVTIEGIFSWEYVILFKQDGFAAP